MKTCPKCGQKKAQTPVPSPVAICSQCHQFTANVYPIVDALGGWRLVCFACYDKMKKEGKLVTR